VHLTQKTTHHPVLIENYPDIEKPSKREAQQKEKPSKNLCDV
jgi:hypothetical protein